MMTIPESARAILAALELYDKPTAGHSWRVARLSERMAEQMGMDADGADGAYLTGMLHDVGKLGVPTQILNKGGSLSPDEWNQIRLHPLMSRNVVLCLCGVPVRIAGAVAHHHERWDGAGYPYGLAGERIPLIARIVAVADALDAMVMTRPYQESRTPDEALWELRANAGTQFDPKVVAACVAVREAALP